MQYRTHKTCYCQCYKGVYHMYISLSGPHVCLYHICFCLYPLCGCVFSISMFVSAFISSGMTGRLIFCITWKNIHWDSLNSTTSMMKVNITVLISHANIKTRHTCKEAALPNRLWCCYHSLNNVISNNLLILLMYKECHGLCHWRWLLLLPEFTNHFLQIDHT